MFWIQSSLYIWCRRNVWRRFSFVNAVDVIPSKLAAEDDDLVVRTPLLSVERIAELLKLQQWVLWAEEGGSHGFPSAVVVNLRIKFFEELALESAPSRRRFGRGNRCCIMWKDEVEPLFHHLSVGLGIMFSNRTNFTSIRTQFSSYSSYVWTYYRSRRAILILIIVQLGFTTKEACVTRKTVKKWVNDRELNTSVWLKFEGDRNHLFFSSGLFVQFQEKQMGALTLATLRMST